jgi:subtilisin family serine protease
LRFSLICLTSYCLTFIVGAQRAPARPVVAQTAPTTTGTNRLLVRFRDPTTRPNDAAVTLTRRAALSITGSELSYLRQASGGWHVLAASDENQLASALSTLRTNATALGIEYVEPDRRIYPSLTPNDAQYSALWAMQAVSTTSYGANFEAAWNVTTGTNTLVVAVLDTGIVQTHPDLAGRFVSGYDFVSDVPTANDGNGRDADPSDPGDWVTSADAATAAFSGCAVTNSSWHGTHVAGTVGATGNNSIGVAGANWRARIQNVRILGKCGGFLSDEVDAIRWAAGLSVPGVPANSTPAKVINMSLGGSGACSTAEQAAINAANTAGAIIVVAAGNESDDVANASPANCAGVITVAATARNGNRASYSNFGSLVTISAPGGDSGNLILSTIDTGTQAPSSPSYAYKAGTSMATPHVAGLVSLMLAANPALTRAQIITLLQSTATQFPAGSTCTTSLCGAGIINAGAAVAAAQALIPPLPTATPTNTSTPTATPTSTASPTNTPTRTPTPTASPTHTPTPTRTPSPTGTNTSTPAPTASGTPSPTGTSTSTPSPTASGTAAAATPTLVVSPDPTPTATPPTPTSGTSSLIYLPLTMQR